MNPKMNYSQYVKLPSADSMRDTNFDHTNTQTSMISSGSSEMPGSIGCYPAIPDVLRASVM